MQEPENAGLSGPGALVLLSSPAWFRHEDTAATTLAESAQLCVDLGRDDDDLAWLKTPVGNQAEQCSKPVCIVSAPE